MENTESSLTNESEKLSLIVKSSTKKEMMEVSNDTTISSFKEVVANKFNADVQSLRLIYAGRILKDTDTLKSLNIKTGYTVYVVIKPPTQSNSRLSSDAVPANSDLESTLTRNLLQYYSNTPDVLRSLLNNNPALQQLIQRNPEIGHLINNPRLLQETMEAIGNPNVANEFVRTADRAMSNIESLPGGFNALQQMYRNVEEPLLDAVDDATNPFINLFTSENLSHQQGSENREPLPNPWSQSGSTFDDEINEDGLANNFLMQNLLEQLQNHAPQLGNTSPQMAQDLQGMLSNVDNSGENITNLQQRVGDLLNQISLRNEHEHSGNEISPETISAVILPALLLAGMARNQPADLSNNNETNANLTSNLLSQLNISGLPNLGNFEEQYTTQMQQLADMGFVNREANLQALIASFGDLNGAIEMLLSRNFAT